MKKPISILLLALSLLGVLSSCEKLKGEGDSIAYEVALTDSFINLEINIPCNIVINYAEEETLTIEAQENIIDNMYWSVESNIFYIEFVQNAYDYNPITLTFNMPEFRDVCLNDETNFNIATNFETLSRIRLEINNTGFITISDSVKCCDFLYIDNKASTLDANYLYCTRDFELTANGFSTINMNGYAKNADIVVNNILEYKGFNFVTESTTLNVSGTSETTNLYVTDKLEAVVSGTAIVRYKGSPQEIITSESTGDLDISASE